MRMKPNGRIRGFTLMELTVAMALGVLVIGTAVGLFSKALDASFVVTQRAEMQQNGRAASDLVAKDVSLAGAGLPPGGVQLPSGTGSTLSLFGCDQTNCYITNNTYPSNNLPGVMPGPYSGIRLTPSGINSDAITMAYTDTTFTLFYYKVEWPDASGKSVRFKVPAPPDPMPNPLPTPWPPVPVNDPVVGLKVGDLVLLSNNSGTAVGEVTNVTGGAGTYDVSFADNDALNINQSAAENGNIKQITGGTQSIAYRLFVITYYLDIPPGPDGNLYTADDGEPRLMRQVSGLPPVPVAEGISGLQFSYDIFDDVSGTNTSNLKDAGMGAGKSPNQIRKVNLDVAARSPLTGHGGYQNFDMANSVSARNMSFKDRYQ